MRTKTAPRILAALALLGGAISCTGLTTEEAESKQVVIPAGWTCSKDLYQNGQCTCGCGVQDVDCAANDRALCRDEGCAEDFTAAEVIYRVPSLADPTQCVNNTCGDGYVERSPGASEGCDDGDNVDANGCSADCMTTDTENRWKCGDNGEGCMQAVCGDGIFDYWLDACDDGNVVGGDGCDATCEIEDGWACPMPEDWSGWNPAAMPCHQVVCGDAIEDLEEDCDDGNTDANDGCSPTCEAETGWNCDEEPCRPIVCGDGITEDVELEMCDDGNLDNNDGCSANCRPEMCSAHDADDNCTGYTEYPVGWDETRCEQWMFGGDGECTCGCGVHDFECPAENVMTASDCVNDGCNGHVDPNDLNHCAAQ